MKYVIVILSLVLLVLAYNSNFFKSGFKFESYTETGRETKFTEDLRQSHPVGSNGEVLKEKLEKAGAKCSLYTKENFQNVLEGRNANSSWLCSYNSNNLSFKPLLHYKVWIFIDRDKNITFIESSVFRGFL